MDFDVDPAKQSELVIVLSRPDWVGDSTMKRTGHTAEQIISKLKTAEQLIAQGRIVVDEELEFQNSDRRTFEVFVDEKQDVSVACPPEITTAEQHRHTSSIE